jgi:hypothetical protein
MSYLFASLLKTFLVSIRTSRQRQGVHFDVIAGPGHKQQRS